MRVRYLVLGFQRMLLWLSYTVHRVIARGAAGTISWVVGPDEVASMVSHMSVALPGSHSVSLTRNKYYDFAYDTTLEVSGGSVPFFRGRLFAGPWLLGKLAARAHGFVYLGPTGYLRTGADERWHEFEFLKKRGLRLVCYFTGSDIRSPKLMLEMQERTGIENIATYQVEVVPEFRRPEYEHTKQAMARAADRFADVIFNARTDQLSYLTRPTEPFLYFYPDDRFVAIGDKFERLDSIRIVHAPSSPIVKGTQVVRAAINRLRELGYTFDYVELDQTPNEVVLATLATAHIALNEFYAFVPGMFGVEAMASGCALLTSADEHLERDLPTGSNAAWMVTSSAQIFDNLRHLLDHPEEIRPLAERGQAWARGNAAASKSAARFRSILAGI